MRFDPRTRLDRRLPGAGVHPEGRVRLHISEDRPARPDPVPARDQKELLDVRQRPTKRVVDSLPYAPQLIRLIRTPYAMAGVRPKRVTLIEPSPTSIPRPRFTDALHEAHADWPEVGSATAIQPRPRAFAPRVNAAAPLPPLPVAR